MASSLQFGEIFELSSRLTARPHLEFDAGLMTKLFLNFQVYDGNHFGVHRCTGGLR